MRLFKNIITKIRKKKNLNEPWLAYYSEEERSIKFTNKTIYEYLKDGFDKCFEVSDVNDIILLSPASASWDQYKECEVRGAEFKKKVEDLKNEN